jgi:hypothetical protein
MPGQQRAQQAGTPGEHDLGAVLTHRHDGPGDDLGGRVVAAHGIDGHRPGRRPRPHRSMQAGQA